MSKLEYEEIKLIKIDSSSLDDFVSEHYNVNFEFVADQLSGNDVDHNFGEFTKTKLDDYDQGKLDKLTGGFFVEGVASIVLQDLVNKDLLPENIEIQVSVSW